MINELTKLFSPVRGRIKKTPEQPYHYQVYTREQQNTPVLETYDKAEADAIPNGEVIKVKGRI